MSARDPGPAHRRGGRRDHPRPRVARLAGLGDPRYFFGAGYALLLQVAHPTVGSGVRDHSNFQADPWGRLMRTTDYLYLLVYGGRGRPPMGRRLRELHKSIKGVNPDGSRYHALEPEAYAWVHATLIEATFVTGERFVGGISAADRERLYAEYMPLGRLVGVRPGDLPETLAEFRDYVDTMIAERLVRHETVDLLIDLLEQPGAAGRAGDRPALAAVAGRALAGAARPRRSGCCRRCCASVSGCGGRDAQQAELRALGAASRALTPGAAGAAAQRRPGVPAPAPRGDRARPAGRRREPLARGRLTLINRLDNNCARPATASPRSDDGDHPDEPKRRRRVRGLGRPERARRAARRRHRQGDGEPRPDRRGRPLLQEADLALGEPGLELRELRLHRATPRSGTTARPGARRSGGSCSSASRSSSSARSG